MTTMLTEVQTSQEINSLLKQLTATSTNYLFGGPLESCHNRVLDFIQVLDSLCTVEEEIRTCAIRSKSPDLTGFCYIILVFLAQVASSCLELISWIHLSLLAKHNTVLRVITVQILNSTLLTVISTYIVNVLSQPVRHRLCLHEKTIVFVRRFWQTHLIRLLWYCLTIRYDWIRFLKRNAGMVFFQILGKQITRTWNPVI